MEREEFAEYCVARGIDADDELRPLTADGIKRTKRAASGLIRAFSSFSEFKPKPFVISSPLVRARQTSDIVLHAIQKSRSSLIRHASATRALTQTPTLSPGAEPKAFRDFLYDWKSQHGRHLNTLVIAVGHEPGLSTAATWWLSGRARAQMPLKKSGAICFEIGNSMKPGEARLLWALPPWALRALAVGK